MMPAMEETIRRECLVDSSSLYYNKGSLSLTLLHIAEASLPQIRQVSWLVTHFGRLPILFIRTVACEAKTQLLTVARQLRNFSYYLIT